MQGGKRHVDCYTRGSSITKGMVTAASLSCSLLECRQQQQKTTLSILEENRVRARTTQISCLKTSLEDQEMSFPLLAWVTRGFNICAILWDQHTFTGTLLGDCEVVKVYLCQVPGTVLAPSRCYFQEQRREKL
uniref:Uncharacterized protein n=1 Tax=Molossus molossus TaxID=27622 RepID=A0A7J8JVX0_MOLMO|nr:hypothetical protein HJG59_008041 [Molossus molossus]